MNNCKQMTLREVMDLRRQLNASDTCYKPEQTSVASEIDNMFCDLAKKMHREIIVDAIYKIALLRRHTSSLHCIQFSNKDSRLQTTGRLFVYLILGFEEEAKREFDLLTTNERKQFVQNIGLIDVAMVSQNWAFPSHVFSRLNTEDRIALITHPGFKFRFIYDHASCAKFQGTEGCNVESKPQNIVSNVVVRPYQDKIVEGGFRPLTIAELSEKDRVLADFLKTVSMFAYNNNVLNRVPDGSLVLKYAETQTSINNAVIAITGIAAIYFVFSRIIGCLEMPIERRER